MSACIAWDTLCICWINTYLGPPDKLIYDAGKNFVFTEFRQLANSIAIKVKEVLIKAYNSVGQVERYYTPLRYTYEII
jgi:hypothetical protein